MECSVGRSRGVDQPPQIERQELEEKATGESKHQATSNEGM